MSKIVKIAHHERLCRISSILEYQNNELIHQINWLNDRFMKSIFAELMSEATLNIINTFNEDKNNSKSINFQFDLIIHAEKKEHDRRDI